MPEKNKAREMLTTTQQVFHPMMAAETHDEHARTEFLRTFKATANNLLFTGGRAVYEGKVRPEFQAKHGRDVQSHDEVRDDLARQPAIGTALGLRRITQEMIWSAAIDSVERQSADLNARAAKIENSNGSVRTNPNLEIPDYLTDIDIHVMPGGYHTERYPGDISQGPILDRGAFIYSLGFAGASYGAQGQSIVHYLQQAAPDFKPRRILDMGCMLGHSTLGLCDAFPDAEIHAIDAGAPMVRYAHARAAALGKTVQFSQQNAECTDFADESFDLVCSLIMFHETSPAAIPKIIAESRRLLRPGGLMAHLDLPDINAIPDIYRQFCMNEDHYDNNEPFWMGIHERDWAADSVAAGFDPDGVKLEGSPMLLAIPPNSTNPKAGEQIVPSPMMTYKVIAARK